MNNLFLPKSYTNTERFTEFIKSNQSYYTNSFQFHIHISVDLNKHLISDDNLHLLQTLMRSLINGKQSIDRVDNRSWFSLYFSGGFYKITITQHSPEDYPTINYHLFAFSNKNNLEETMPPELIMRLQKIIPIIELKKFKREFFVYDGYKNIEEVLDKINLDAGFHFDSAPVKSLPNNFIRWMYRVMYEEPKTFGEVYKKMHLSYLY